MLLPDREQAVLEAQSMPFMAVVAEAVYILQSPLPTPMVWREAISERLAEGPRL